MLSQSDKQVKGRLARELFAAFVSAQNQCPF